MHVLLKSPEHLSRKYAWSAANQELYNAVLENKIWPIKMIYQTLSVVILSKRKYDM